jgi:hypothetical protein
MIHELDGGTFVISSGHSWLPGRYESRQAANYAFRFPDQALSRLQTEKNLENGGTNGLIKFCDLQELARRETNG